MSEALAFDLDIEDIVTEDDEPVDNLASEKQQRLLTEPLYSYPFQPPDSEIFLAAANVGVFYSTHQPPLVPDMFLSLDVQVADNWWEKQNRSYFVWEFGKPPDVAVEIVSNRKGKELDRKLRDYAKIGVKYYVVFDPSHQISTATLQVFQLQGRFYSAQDTTWLEQVGLGLTLWTGAYEGKTNEWLRWCDRNGQVIPTGAEKAEAAQQQAEAAQQQAELAQQQVEAVSAELDAERQRSQRLSDRLREMGIDPTAL
ncbi:Uma2 family endonuclease [Pseudanabaena sp. PCC 6802]|uniref:Uma2 family endonuclease n=1 Tax=Pseudanabaena sp. PCC 6802 TaxID=118173 RepID=UPI000348EE70|nr:Uma2 family endonuclease [Pseudanabaena sp. PCC 6802]